MSFFPRVVRFPKISTLAVGAAACTAFAGHKLMQSPMTSPLQTRISTLTQSFKQSVLPTPIQNESTEHLKSIADKFNNETKTKLNGKIDYHQLTFGSFTGMVTGYIFGRISKLLVGVVVTSLMATEYLSMAGYIDMKPFYKGLYNFFYDNLHQEVLVNDPSFKYSFGLAFLISAYNA